MTRFKRDGLTWVEVLVIAAIVVVVIGLMFPAARRISEPSERMRCQNNLKQLGLGLHNFHDSGRVMRGSRSTPTLAPAMGALPTGCIGPGSRPEERLSWLVEILPFIEQQSLYQQIDLEKGYAGNLPAAQVTIRLLLCPSSKAAPADAPNPVTNYVAMAGIGFDAAAQPAGAPGNGFMGYDRKTSITMIKDGTSNTIALMETQFEPGPWARGGFSTLRGIDPADGSLQGEHAPFGIHKEVMNAAMADGSVRSVPLSIDPIILAAAITVAGGEPPFEIP
jgi:hypothetical protein